MAQARPSDEGMHVDDAPEPDVPGPLVAQDVLGLDVRERPTHEEAGFAEGRSVIFERVREAIDVELELPQWLQRLDAVGVSRSGPAGPAAEQGLSRTRRRQSRGARPHRRL